ncbi:hypothetical protein [Dermacoccus nishinomiyaensis]|uniref:hypothetical protein n=1 Tax=Dermacoccus nishinomiyaensis TaxID=1274 RepID=UPI001F50C6AE|nr:hypothetical protein [Dermacoccus nishinomiyaensis]MCI0153978.1 hypothetical protein [Dermacoccus nishinomiyaensis]
MRIAYTPGEASGDAVAHLCAPDNTFVGPTTFPGAHTLEQYADAHGELMTKLDDLPFVSFHVEFVKEWNKLPIRERLGWPIEEGLTYHE